MSVNETTQETNEVPPEQVEVPIETTTEEVTTTEPESNGDAEFTAGFNAVQGIETPEPEPEPEPQVQPPSYTPEQVKELIETVEALKQRESKIFGSMGSLKQAIDAIKAQPAAAAPAMKWGPDKLKRLSAEFPEIAKILSEDLSDMSVGGESSNPDQVAELVEQRVKTSLEKTEQAFEIRLLNLQHKDWRDVVKGEEFIGWKESLPPDEKAELDSSWNADFIGQKISDFKEWKAKTLQTKQTNQRRLEAAITPKGTSGPKPAPTENDAFLAGFKSVRGA